MTSEILHGNELKVELHYFFSSRNDLWNWNILIFAVSDQHSKCRNRLTFPNTVGKIKVLSNWSCLFNSFCYKELVGGVWVCCQLFFNYGVQHYWQILRHIWMLTFSSALLALPQDQQKQEMQHVLNTDKPELWPGRDGYFRTPAGSIFLTNMLSIIPEQSDIIISVLAERGCTGDKETGRTWGFVCITQF